MSNYFTQNSNTCRFDSADSWVILSPIEQSIKQKIEAVGTPLKDWDINIYRGILTGFNEAFIIDGEKRKELIGTDPKSAEIIRPLLRGRDIKRYSYDFADLYLITTFPSLNLDIDEYPAVKNHLLSFGIERLEQTGKTYKINGQTIKARKKTNNKWFETQDSIGYWEEFSKQKIVYQELTQGSSFWFDENSEYFVSNTGYLITGNKLKFLYSLLNSEFIEFIFRKFYSISLGGKGLRWLAQYIENIPIIYPDDNELERRIINLLAQNDYDEINKEIYKLYNLTEEETSFIEKQ